jgi:hypothetical protein
MFVDRFETDAQFRSHLFVRLAFGDQLEDLDLARTQPIFSLWKASLLTVHFRRTGPACAWKSQG